jgi:DNA polymerase zeta
LYCYNPNFLTGTISTYSGRQLDVMYYIKHQIIPPLERIFNLVGADVSAWFDEMPKPQRIEGSVTDKKPSHPNMVETPYRTYGKKMNQNQKIDTHFGSNTCLICEATTMEGRSITSCGIDLVSFFLPSSLPRLS